MSGLGEEQRDDGGKGLGRRQWAHGITTALPMFTISTFSGVGRPSMACADEDGSSVGAPPSTDVGETVAPAPAPFTFADGFPAETTVPYKGKGLPLKKFRAKVTLVVNTKTDDPEGTRQLPALAYLSTKYAPRGLRVLAFPTDQGWYEPEVSDIVRLRALQTYGFGAFPNAVVFDKVDLLGKTAHPLYQYLMSNLRNPNGRAAVSLNFEKFLLDATGKPVRRYPRKYDGYQIEKDVDALINGEPLPDESDEFVTAWKDAERESIKSEYAFRVGYNLYIQNSASSDWAGIASDGFR